MIERRSRRVVLFLELRPALQGLLDGHLVGEIEVRAHRQAHGQAGDPYPESLEDPVKIERDLMGLVPEKDWFVFSYLLQSLGRDACVARGPECLRCVLTDICPKKIKDN